ncbi:MAG TPA: DUF4112 domain-containing protein [Propylenella sp.]|nr:DUF4112 domain-containing protein [Propylenella sp.]
MAAEPEILPPRRDAPVQASFGREELDRIERRLERLATALDSAIRIPGVGVRFGADAILGLIPGIGDAVSLGLSGYLILEAHRLGASPLLLARMAGHLIVDATVGAVPIAGDVFDVFYKANRRNMALLRRHIDELRAAEARVVNPRRAG